MKNRIMLIAMVVVAAIGMISCGNPAEPEEFTLTIDNVNNYIVSIGEYEGLTVPGTSRQISEESAEYYMDVYFRKLMKSVENWKAAEGDAVEISYKGTDTATGKKELSGSNQSVIIGEGTHLEGFEEALIGAAAGEKVEFTISIPADYPDELLAGKEYLFDVDVISVTPELSDESIAALNNENYSNLDEFKVFINNALRAYKNDADSTGVFEQVITQVVENTTFTELPEAYLNEKKEYVEQVYSDTAATYDVSVDYYLKLCGTSIDDEALNYAKRQMVVYKIASDRGFTVSDEELDAYADEYVQYYPEYEDRTDFFLANPREELSIKLLYNKVEDYLVDVTKTE